MISTEALNLQVKGVVQGVGFRPFVYRMAQKHHVAGWVLNAADGVRIHAEGESDDLDRFALAVANEAPAAAQVKELSLEECPVEGFADFEIRFSQDADVEDVTLVSPDLATCDACVDELFDPANRRYRYPFINCTNCGPRFTIIDGLPYDRATTSMASFEMCPTCANEYVDPADRRFHAQPDACFECGPAISYEVFGNDAASAQVKWGVSREASDEILAQGVELLCAGGVLAVKGLGGFHLACDADNAQAVADLRARKHRDGKALAVMVPDARVACEVCRVDDEERALLESPARPIVLLEKRPDARIGAGVADGLPELGVMLPSTPLQHLLVRDFVEAGGRMLVMTSGNLHDEPIVIDDDEAQAKLSSVADAMIGNNRTILSRFDDSVVRVMHAGAAGEFVQVVRRARGYAPAPLPFDGELAKADAGQPAQGDAITDGRDDSDGMGHQDARAGGAERLPIVLAVGPEQKNTLTLAQAGRAFVSQHVGDLEDAAVYDAWLEAKRRLTGLFRLEPTVIAADMHPSYLSTQWADGQSLPVEKVQHHHAHVAAVMAENDLEGPVCGIAFDGTGYGVDGNVWGGEVLICNRSAFERFANFAYVPMPGGAAAVKNPLRMAYGLLWEWDLLEHPGARGVLEGLGDMAPTLVRMIDQGINTPYTSSVGRLFDAVSAILGICVQPTYQGEGAILLEAAIASDDDGCPTSEGDQARYAVSIVKNTATSTSTAEDTSVVLFDASTTFAALLDDLVAGVARGTIARRFHEAIVTAVVQAAQLVNAVYGITTVALAGGVFMNRFVMEHAVSALSDAGFTVAVSRDLPPNDGSVSYGQAVVVWSRTLEGECER